MSSLNIRTVSRVLLSASAVLLFHAQSGLAADVGGDPQGQARELLSPTQSRSADIYHHVAVPRALVSDRDPQTQAQELILGERSFVNRFELRSQSPEAVRGSHRGHADAQAMARRMILGTVG